MYIFLIAIVLFMIRLDRCTLKCKIINAWCIGQVLINMTGKNQHFRVRFWGGGTSKSVCCVRFHKCR